MIRARNGSSRRGKGINAKMLKLVQGIPGYDPIASAPPGFWFDEPAAQRALDFFPKCIQHVKGEWARSPFALERWQGAVVANAFGWKAPDGMRRYREVFIFVPRKNGKTTLGAGLILYLLFCDGEPGAECYSAASDREQAGLVFQQAERMTAQEPELGKRCRVFGGGPAGQAKTITLLNNSGFYKVLSGEADTKDGLNTHGAIVDEVHAHPNRKLMDVILTSTGSRRQPLVFELTTSDYDRPSICNEKLKYAERVRDAKFGEAGSDPSFLPVIYAANRKDDWRDPAVWKRANPNYGVSIKADYLRRECDRAMEIPAYENTFKRLHLNLTTEQAVRWLPMDKWDDCAGAVMRDQLLGHRCFAGLDLSTTTDVSALMLIFPEDGNAVLRYYWVPADNAHGRELRDRVPYERWGAQGLVELTPGRVIDYGYIRKRVNEIAGDFGLVDLQYDPWNAQPFISQIRDQDGIHVTECRQGFASMNAPCKELEKLILSANLQHGGDPVLRWMAGNVAVVTDPAGNIKLDKEHSFERIDGMVALVMAVRGAMQAEGIRSVYEERGILTF